MKETHIKVFLFDLDGTLWDSEDAICGCLQNTLLSEKGMSVDKRTIRKELREYGSPMRLLKNYNIQNTGVYWRRYREYMDEIPLFFRNTHSVFEKLREHNKMIGYVTSLKKEFASTLLKKHSLDRYASVTITPSECRISKPNPSSVLMAINALSMTREETIYVGDQISDIEAAGRAGCKSGFASWSGRSLDEDEPDYILRELKELTLFL